MACAETRRVVLDLSSSISEDEAATLVFPQKEIPLRRSLREFALRLSGDESLHIGTLLPLQ